MGSKEERLKYRASAIEETKSDLQKMKAQRDSSYTWHTLGDTSVGHVSTNYYIGAMEPREGLTFNANSISFEELEKKARDQADTGKSPSAEGERKNTCSLEKGLKIYEELLKKDIGSIYLTGSLALHLQGVLDRTEYSDLDIGYIGDLELDDEFENYYRKNYGFEARANRHRRTVGRLTPEDVFGPPTLSGDKEREPSKEKSKINSYMFDGVILDFFEDISPNVVEVLHKGKEYKCLYYKDILAIKLDAALSKFKDKEFLLNNIIEIKIK